MVTITFDKALTLGVDINTTVSAVAGGTKTTFGGTGADVTQGKAAVAEVTTVTLTDGTNTGLTLGDTMSLKVNGTTYTYTADAATVTMADAGTALAALIAADSDVLSAVFSGTNLITITDKTAGSPGLLVGGYAVTDAAAGGAKGDTLIGGDGNDTLIAGTLTQMTGGAGNDTFVMTKVGGDSGFSSILDFQSGDIIKASGGNTFVSTQVAHVANATLTDILNKVITESVDGDVCWFQSGGNTYVVENAALGSPTAFTNHLDMVIEIVGLKDLSTASFNTTNGTIEMV